MSCQPSLSNTIHLRDFVDTVTDDPNRNTLGCVEIQTDINIFEEDGFYSPKIIVEPVRTRIHAYLTREERETHPGDVIDFDEYRQHLPGQWYPMVSVIGSVSSCDANSTDTSEPRSFVIETSVYDTSKHAQVQYSMACFLENTKRWEKVKTPQLGSLLSVTAKVAGRTTDANHLALRVLDLAYLPISNSAASVSSPATTPSSKRSRWDRLAPSSTPTKKPRLSEPVGRITTPSGTKTTTPGTAQTGLDDTMKSPFVPFFAVNRCQLWRILGGLKHPRNLRRYNTTPSQPSCPKEVFRVGLDKSGSGRLLEYVNIK
ncbi:hypothetical protein B0H66DRAFT_631865 [Apodospora peruviana]|uniref:Uncharacterized protein n=1 Tax=Apodospora peruviana TaxID=516989 RepID=A0AAE0HU59_9PEZI|nr:hypothetical protein B0H66DRAFT_631865 [Apodospora peruviana]